MKVDLFPLLGIMVVLVITKMALESYHIIGTECECVCEYPKVPVMKSMNSKITRLASAHESFVGQQIPQYQQQGLQAPAAQIQRQQAFLQQQQQSPQTFLPQQQLPPQHQQNQLYIQQQEQEFALTKTPVGANSLPPPPPPVKAANEAGQQPPVTSSSITAEKIPSKRRITILTMANKPNKMFCYTLRSAAQHDIELNVLGWDLNPINTWIGPDESNPRHFKSDYYLGSKLVLPQVYFDKLGLPDDHLVAFVDSSDVIFQYPIEILLEKYERHLAKHPDYPVVFAVEHKCGTRDVQNNVCETYKRMAKEAGDKTFVAFNSGFYIGPVGEIRKIMQAAASDDPQFNREPISTSPYYADYIHNKPGSLPKVPIRYDQSALGILYTRRTFPMTLDYDSDFAMTMWGMWEENPYWDFVSDDGYVKLTRMQQAPWIAHYNQLSDQIVYLRKRLTASLGDVDPDTSPDKYAIPDAKFRRLFSFYTREMERVSVGFNDVCSSDLGSTTPWIVPSYSQKAGLIVEEGISYNGGSNTRTRDIFGSLDQCLVKCHAFCLETKRDHDDCDGWTWRGKTCYLKSDISGRSRQHDAISAKLADNQH